MEAKIISKTNKIKWRVINEYIDVGFFIENEVRMAVHRLKNKKALGPGQIYSKVVKMTIERYRHVFQNILTTY